MEFTEQKLKVSPRNLIAHTRKNHALEHATITLLSKAVPNVSFSGYSIHKGFWILGNAELLDVQKSAEMALARLKNGERKLAIHPNCGTNIAMIGLCTAAAAMLVASHDQEDETPFSRFSAFTTAGMIGALGGKPLGPKVQEKLTTDADVSALSIVSITCRALHGTPTFFIETALD